MRSVSLVRRTLRLLLGLFIFGVSVTLMIRSELGLGPWDAFHVGLAQLTGISVGLVMIAVGLVIVIGALGIGIRPGPGTIANMILIGIFADLLLPFTPAAPGLIWPWVYLLAGIALCGLATGIYLSAGLGAGPRDSLMVGLAEKTRWPIRRVRTLIEVSALGLGWIMGGKIGIGTVAFTLLVGPAAQWGIALFPQPVTAPSDDADRGGPPRPPQPRRQSRRHGRAA